MSTVDEIIQNLIAKQEEIDQEQSSARVNVNEIKATIKLAQILEAFNFVSEDNVTLL